MKVRREFINIRKIIEEGGCSSSINDVLESIQGLSDITGAEDWMNLSFIAGDIYNLSKILTEKINKLKNDMLNLIVEYENKSNLNEKDIKNFIKEISIIKEDLLR